MVIVLPILLIQSIGFIIIKPKKRTSKHSKQISPSQNGAVDQGQNRNQNWDDPNPKSGQNGDLTQKRTQSNKQDMVYSAYRFYCAPVTKFAVYMVGPFFILLVFIPYQIEYISIEILNLANIKHIYIICIKMKLSYFYK